MRIITLLFTLLSLLLVACGGIPTPTLYQFNRVVTKPFRVIGKVVPMKGYRPYWIVKRCTRPPSRCVVVPEGFDVDKFRLVVETTNEAQANLLHRKDIGDTVNVNLYPRSLEGGDVTEIDGEELEVYFVKGVR